MESLWDLGISIILWLQGLGNWLVSPMKFFSFLGNEEFFLLIMPVFFWCINAAVGFRLGMLLLISSNLSTFFKLLWHGPRPYWYSTSVRAWSTETSFGLPSGHSMSAASVWGGLAASLRKRWAWIAAILVIFLIGLSRMFLAVHFPTDVLVGWTLGGLLLVIYLKLEPGIKAWVLKQTTTVKLVSAFGFSLVMIGLGAGARALLGGWTLPDVWVTNAVIANPTGDPLDPLSLSGIISNSGALFGMCAGWLLVSLSGGFDAGGLLWKRAVRFLIGLVGILLFWRGLGMILPSGDDTISYALRYLRYTLIGFWIAGLGPLLFIRLGLASKPSVGKEKRRRVRAAVA